jgi:uncharacterized protein (TIGR02246 family)
MTQDAERPALSLSAEESQDAAMAVDRLIDELQAGWDQQDADITNRHFAKDLLWGSPFGATVRGYDELHPIHQRLKAQGRGGRSSRYELVQMMAPAPDLAVAQVRRVALEAGGEPIEPTDDTSGSFSEMALYVLVRRNDAWWLAAGQNTPVRPAPTN